MNLSFAGCGFLGIYHIGVACCFRKYAPHLLLNKISGASAGAIAACCLLLDLPLGETTSDILRLATEARKKSLGPFNPSFNIHRLLMEGLEKFLPADAHIRVSGKLHISLTRVCDGQNVIVTQYDTRDELIQALLASSFIPIFSGLLPPKFKNTRYMDGGYSDNLPTLDENTITVSPFCGESDICPRDDSAQLFHINVANTSIELSKHNIYRILRILFPPHPEKLANLCKQGFDDALRFLHKNNLINCTKCLAVQSTFVVSDTIEESLVYDPQCKDCKIHRQEALVSNVPETVLSVFQEVIDAANKGVSNWVYRHRGMKLFSILCLPYTLPADMVCATFTKMVSTVPHVRNAFWDLSKVLAGQVSSVLKNVNKKTEQLSAKITCHLAVTEYGGVDTNMDIDPIQNEMNLNFTLDLDDSDLQHPEHKFNTKQLLQRKPSFTINKTDDSMDDDTFDHILEVTSDHDAVMAYYYLDENNKVKVTEIFDVTDSESSALQTPHERDLNKNLEFDDIWTGLDYRPNEPLDDQMSEYSVEDVLDNDKTLFSDPESEWVGSCTVEEPDDEPTYTKQSTDARPESDRTTLSASASEVLKTKCTVPSFSYEEINF
ncbi:1-acylglycerol-3-phosphate O-acyltransferase Pnpla3 isoform X2 [Dendroctonus ponderosae]|uniref:1-acylglycerol-3-phosphate O-acyltransferase Pnpla3 isoform X2 n=1 Tax=Dendroctonus ponderosae TaxID=77166 RepID=UPI0020355492|nr:1-acylglycerol-3-phosphate O-acyltransferase Pnpla3 isoform X2 [Dendroctonus ponderosae]